MRAGQQSHSCTLVSHDDCTGLGMSAACLTDYHGAECMNVNDVQAAGRPAFETQSKKDYSTKGTPACPRLLVTSFPGFVP